MKIAADIRFKHGTLWEIVNRSGGAAAFADAIGVGKQTVYGWLNLRTCPTPGKYTRWYTRESEQALEELSGMNAGEVFPPGLAELCRQMLREDRHYISMREIPADKLESLGQRALQGLPCPDAGRDPVDRAEIAEQLASGVSTLTERERRVITLRYGLGGESEMTLEEIGEELGVGKERVRQIENRALRRMHETTRNLMALEMPMSRHEELCIQARLRSRDKELSNNKDAPIKSVLGHLFDSET